MISRVIGPRIKLASRLGNGVKLANVHGWTSCEQAQLDLFIGRYIAHRKEIYKTSPIQHALCTLKKSHLKLIEVNSNFFVLIKKKYIFLKCPGCI